MPTRMRRPSIVDRSSTTSGSVARTCSLDKPRATRAHSETRRPIGRSALSPRRGRQPGHRRPAAGSCRRTARRGCAQGTLTCPKELLVPLGPQCRARLLDRRRGAATRRARAPRSRSAAVGPFGRFLARRSRAHRAWAGRRGQDVRPGQNGRSGRARQGCAASAARRTAAPSAQRRRLASSPGVTPRWVARGSDPELSRSSTIARSGGI